MPQRDYIFACFVFMTSMLYNRLYCVTEVYNLRVTTLTAERINLDEKFGSKNFPGVFTSKAVMRIRENNRTDKQLLVANVSSIIYSYKNFYARADGAFGYVREKLTNVITKHTQTDDILLSVGYNHQINPRLSLTYTVSGGIPTHKDYGFQYYQFGTGHYAIAGQLAAILKNETHSWISALRAIHFFKAKATVPLETTCISVDFALGNVTDIVIAFYKSFRKDHSLEIGYNPTFATNLSTRPALDPLLPSSGIRNSWYSIYRYAFETEKHPMAIGLSASYGFDISPKIDAALKNNMSFWISYTIKF